MTRVWLRSPPGLWDDQLENDNQEGPRFLDVPPASQTQYIQIKIQYLSLLAQFILPPVFPISEEAPSITEGINYFFSLSSIFLLSQMIFFNYIFWLCYYSYHDFSPLSPSTQCPHFLRQSPNHCSCPWVMLVSSLAAPFSILYFTSPWLFCNYLFVLLNPLISSPILSLPLPT